jgi:hypothetical protein
VFENELLSDLFRNAKIRLIFLIGVQFVYFHQFFSKALEHIIFDHLDAYIESNKLYDTFQSGFRKLHSTSTALINISDKIRRAKDEHKISLLILLDFSKAFNCINYDILCYNLFNFYNFLSDAADLMLNFLQGRSYDVG